MAWRFHAIDAIFPRDRVGSMAWRFTKPILLSIT